MTLQEFGLLVLSVLSSVAGQFFLKIGASKLGKVLITNALSHIISIVTVPELIAGLASYGLGAVAYILLLTRVKLSIAAPCVSLVYVFSVLLGWLVFKESMPSIRLVGLSFIVIGVILVVWQK